MNKIHLGTWMGVPLYAHWSMLIFYAIIVPTFAFWTPQFWYGVITTTTLFTVIAIHEYAHMWEGLRLGYDIEDIHLIAIGGIAGFEDIPTGTWDEFRISIAGPMVNLILFIWTTLLLSGNAFEMLANGGSPFAHAPWTPEFWALFAILNFVFFAFNMLPIYPSDGGRIFRSLLAQAIGVKHATRAATFLGSLGGLALIVFGAVHFNVINVLVGVFLIFLVYAEYLNTVKGVDFDTE